TPQEHAVSKVRTIAATIETTPQSESIAQPSARTLTRRAMLALAGVGAAAGAIGLAVRLNRETPRSYVANAIDIMQKYSYRRGQVDWARVRKTALAEAASATTFAATYPAIRAALERLRDRHSHLLTPARMEQLRGRSPAQPSAPKVERLGDIGYIMVPGFASIDNEAGTRFALDLQRMIQAVD